MNINLKLEKKVLFIYTVIGFLLASFLPYIIDIVRFFLKIDKPESYNIFPNIFLFVLIGPIIEELLFRKRLLEFLKKINKKNWFLFLSPFAFTLNHPFIMNSFIYSIFIFFIFYFYSFLLLSLPYYFTDRLEIAIINHALYNKSLLSG
jgi:membrane protease YdiL (CAAX protease family)